MNNYCAYVHTNKANGFRYVGITQQDPERRWQKGHGYRKQSVFWNAIKKYGWDGFTHEIVASGLSEVEAWTIERELIDRYKSSDRNYGYNRSTGGESGAKGVPKNETQRAAASRALKQKWQDPEYREKAKERLLKASQTEEARRKRAESNMGRVVSEETRSKISKSQRGIKRSPFTSEHIQHMKEHHKGGADKRPVFCVEQNTIYASINDAARETGINKKGISGCCRCVKHYNTAGGYHWKFA